MAKKPPRRTTATTRDEREERLKAALKANMARRKAQMRARAQAVGRSGDGGNADGAGKED